MEIELIGTRKYDGRWIDKRSSQAASAGWFIAGTMVGIILGALAQLAR